jgi:hypothetical protein
MRTASQLRILHCRPVASDSIVGLDNLEAGWAFPLVEVAEETNCGFTVLVSVFGDQPELTKRELADIEGTVAELMWADKATQRAS